MATSYTSFLGLALPVTGELQGTWGDVVNDSITSLLDSAIAGTTTLSTDGDVTLTTTNGASNQAREAILLCSGARTALRTITAPAQSKIYTIINATTGGYAVKLVGAGPTTGLTIPNGASAVVAWNGSDFIEIGSSTIGNLTVNGNLSVTGTTSTGVLSVTGNATLGDAAADTVTVNGTITSNLIFTDNTYDIGASGATRPRNYYGSGSATLGMGGTSTSVSTRLVFNGASGTSSYSGIVASRNGTNFWYFGDYQGVSAGNDGLINYVYGANPWVVYVNGGEAIRVNGTATGVGIFQNNPQARLDIYAPASSTVTGLLVQSSGTLANNDVFRVQINGLTNGFRMFQDASSAVKYSFEGGNVGINTTSARSPLSSRGNIGLDDAGILNNLYYDGVNWRYSYTALSIGWVQASNTSQIYWGTAPASGTQDAIATVTTRMYLQDDGLLQLVSGPTWTSGGFSGLLGKQLCMGYDTANSIGYVRSANNGTTATPLYLDSSQLRINIGTSVQAEVARFISTGLTFAGSSDIKTTTGYLNISAASTLVLDTGSGTSMTFRRGSSDIGYWDGNGLAVGTATSPSKLTVSGGNVTIGGGSGYLYNTYYGGGWNFLEDGWGGGSYIDGAGTWNMFMSTATNSSGYGAGASVLNVISTAYNKSIALQGAAPQTGTGITFPASQYPSTNANTLDDYEEGTWTPVWTGGGVSISYSEQTGRYIKIGKMVYFSVRLVVNSASGGSGNLKLDGLPFATVNAGSNPGFVSINFSYGWSGTGVLACIPTANSTTLDCYTEYAAYNSNTQVPVSALTAGGTIYFIAGGCYEAAN